MSFTDNYLELRKKKKKQEETSRTIEAPLFVNKTAALYAQDDIAPVKTTSEKEYTNLKSSGDTFRSDKEKEKSVAKTILGEEEETSTMEHLGLMAMKGLSDFNVGVSSTLALLEKPYQALFPGAATPLGDLADYYKEANEEYTTRLEESKKSRSTAEKILTDVGSSAVAAIPQAIAAVMSGGASLGAQSATLGATTGSGIIATVGTALKTLAKNPLYWTSVTQTLGTDYEEAKKNGASETEAVTTAVISSALNAGIEVGGGTEVLPERLKKGGASAVYQWVKSALEEGREEVVQGVISGITEKSIYNEDKELFSTEDENAIVNPGRMAQEFGMGAAVGGVLGGGQIAAQGIANAVQANEAKKLTENEQKVVDKEYENRIAEEEKGGKKLTEKEKSKLYDTVVSDMEKGRISTDTIEEVLGGKTYEDYSNTVLGEDTIFNEYEELGKKKDATLAEQTRYKELHDLIPEIKKESQREQLKSRLGEEVFGLVKGDRLVESYNEKAKRGQAFEADLTKYDTKQQETIKKAAESGILNNTRRTHEFVDMIAKISADKGVLFDFTDNQKLKDSGFAIDGKEVNGYVTKDGITLNVNSAKALNSVVGHEITHVLEGTELYDTLKQTVFDYAKTKGEYQSRYDSLTKLYEGVKDANIDAELAADLVGDYLFTDSDFINNLSTNNRNVFQKIYDEIKYLCKVATAGSKEARELEKVKRAFDKAYKESGEVSNDTKYSLMGKNQDGIEVYETSQDTMDLTWDERKAQYLDVMKNEYRGRTAKFERNGHVYYAKFDQSSVRKPIYGDSRSSKNGVKAIIKAGADGDVFDLVENSKYTGSKPNTKTHTNADYFDYFVKTVQIDGKVFDLVADVEKEYGTDEGYVYTLALVDNKKIKASPALGTPNTGPVKNAGNAYGENVAQEKPSVKQQFSLSESVEETKDLMALHNLQSSELLKSLDLGGLPMPSIAVIKAEAGHDQYGDVSLILPKETIDPKANRDNKVYGGDAWTPTYPRIEYKPNAKAEKRISDKYYELGGKVGYDAVRPLYSYMTELDRALNNAGGEAAMLEELYDDTRMMQVYLYDSGKGRIEPIIKETRTEATEAEKEMNQWFIDKLGEDVIRSFKAPAGVSPFTHRRAFMEQYGEQAEQAYRDLLVEKFDFTPEDVSGVLDNTDTKDLMRFLRDAASYLNNGGVTIKSETDYQATDAAIREAANDGYKEWVDNLFKGVEEKSGIRNNQDYYTRSGNPRSWDALHWENTLENVVKVMKAQDDTGTDSFNPFNNLFSKAHKQYGSIAEIKADSNRLSKIPEDEYEALKDSFSTRFAEIANSIKDPTERNPFIATDNAAELIVDAVRTQKTKSGMLNYLRKWNSRATAQTVDDVVSLVSDIANMPTGYFEAKPKRAVGFDEVGVFVIPNNIDAKVKQELLNRGYSIAEYDPNVEGDRTKVLNQFEEYKFSLSNVGEEAKTNGNYNVFGKDIALTQEETQVESEENLTSAPVSEVVSAENATTTIEHSVTDLAEIAKGARREEFRGAYTHNGKQYLSDGSLIAEFNTVDESIEQSNDFPIKQAVKELDESFARIVEGNYDLHISDTKGFIKVGNSLFGAKRVNALIRALENPVFSLANVRGGHEALVVTADNGRAVLMPVRASGNAYLVYEAQPIAETATFPDDLAPVSEAYEADRLASLDDADAPPEMEAPASEEVPFRNGQVAEADDPFADREVPYGNEGKKVKAYMYENPEVKPFFQAEAAVMLEELNSTTKGERWFNSKVDYEFGSEAAWGGVSRNTSDSIAELLDDWKMSYADIEKGLNAIIEDNGAENIAAAKKIEFMLNDRLMNGYKSYVRWEPTMDKYGNVPANEDYINLLNEKQVTEYSKEAFDALMAEADKYAPPTDEIAPVAKPEKVSTFEAIKPKPEKQPKLAKATPAEQARASVLTEEPKIDKKGGAWSKFKNLVLDKGAVFEDLSLKTGNRELQARWNSIRYADGKAQRLIGDGNASVSSLNSIREAVEETGKTQQFYEYLYHLHNADRMTLADRYENTPNKPVFGDSVTADESRNVAAQLEKANPEFKQFAKEVYDYMNYLREQMVDSGIISNETAKLWAEMYPHYVPIRRVGDSGLNINVPLDTGKTGVNAPIKRATGGSRDILPLFDTMGQRTLQTYKAIAKNRFGVELKNTLGTTIESDAASIDELIDGIDTNEGLLQEGKDGMKPTFTVFENGERVTFEITDEMYDAMKPTSDALSGTSKTLNTISNVRRGTLTEYNPWFMLKNAVKDVQDVLINSQHATRTYMAIPKAISQMATNGHWYAEYIENGGEQNSYFDSQTNTFEPKNTALEIAKTVTGLNAISKANNIVERLPRLAEYIASREAGRSVDVAMLDAARVTTNFAAGGDLTKFLNRNGATFLNASVQGAMQQARNIREAKMNGLKGWANLAAKFAVAGLPAIALNHLLWDDDEEYAELSDYVKENYYIVGKYGDGKFVRIPKGRTVAVIQSAFEQMENLVTGNDEADLSSFLNLLVSNLAPNNPLDNNVLSPIIQVANNETWYGEDLVPTRLQDLPNAEQYDESTDAISKWLGEKFDISPVKANYLLDQYSGVIGDTFLPMLTPEAESGDDSIPGNMIAPLKDMFTTDGVMKNQNVSDFYETVDELTKNAKSSKATDEDVLKSKYMNSVNSELSELYKKKREIQNSSLSDSAKYSAVREVQEQIVDLTRESLNSHEDVTTSDTYATVADRHYRRNKDGEWEKITDKQLEKQEEVTSYLGISPTDYWGNKEEYDYAYEYPEKYAVAKSVGGYSAYKEYSSALYDIKADKDENGDSITGSRKKKVIDWLNELDADYYEKIILFKSEYNADDTYNYEIIDYLNSRNDISYEEMETILKELGFDVSSDGTISW